LVLREAVGGATGLGGGCHETGGCEGTGGADRGNLTSRGEERRASVRAGGRVMRGESSPKERASGRFPLTLPLGRHPSPLKPHFSPLRFSLSLFALQLSFQPERWRRSLTPAVTSQICDFSKIPCALSRDVAPILHVHLATGSGPQPRPRTREACDRYVRTAVPAAVASVAHRDRHSESPPDRPHPARALWPVAGCRHFRRG
jgi:hypothetical protein